MFTDDSEGLHRGVSLGMDAFTSYILVFSIICFLKYIGYKVQMLVSNFKTSLTLFRFLPHLVG